MQSADGSRMAPASADHENQSDPEEILDAGEAIGDWDTDMEIKLTQLLPESQLAK